MQALQTPWCSLVVYALAVKSIATSIPAMPLLQVNTSVTVTANLVQLAAAPAVTSSATCYFADPVWVLSGSTGNQTVYAPSFPRLPIGPTLVAPVPGLDLQQLQARVSPLQLASQVPANTSGWMVWANNIIAAELLPWNANASQVQAALRAVTNISLTVSASRWDMAGRHHVSQHTHHAANSG